MLHPHPLRSAYPGLLLAAMAAGCAGEPGATDRAREVATSDPACLAIAPFYWAIGDANGTLASGSVGEGAPTESTRMAIASASKWIYGAYVVELRDGALTDADVQALTFRSGYTNFDICGLQPTVETCLARGTNGDLSPENVGKFFYNGGHMQKHAVDIGLGALTGSELATEIRSLVGAEIDLSYPTPQLAGGISSTAGDYARFLRRVLGGELRMREALGTHATCTHPATCADAVYTPIPPEVSWHYSIGHWVEDDPMLGDGAFSSAGAFGFYPWIDSTLTYWGVIARYDLGAAEPATTPAYDSVLCGSLVRRAFLDAGAP